MWVWVGGGDYRRVVEIWQWNGPGAVCGGAVDRQTRVSGGVATLAAEGASVVFCTTSGAGGRDC